MMNFVSSQAEFVAALFDPDVPVPAGLTTASGSPDATRFGVYRNNVMVALIGALEQRFPVTRRLVGDDFFRMMARAYVGVSKPASPLIFEYGNDFPDFADGFEAAQSVAYLPDVARLEAAWTNAYHAADAVPLDVAGVASIAPDSLPFARIVRHPSAALIRSAYPAGSIWGAHQYDTVSVPAEWRPETILVVRPGLDVQVHIVPQQDAGFAGALLAGEPIGEAAQAAVHEDGFDFGAAIVGLVSLGAFAGLDFNRKGVGS